MNSKINSGTFEISRNKEGKLISVMVAMPFWGKDVEDSTIQIKAPLLGINTYAYSQEDVLDTIKDAISLFVANCEKFGKGLETELKLAGWHYEVKNKANSIMSFDVNEDKHLLIDLMETGDKFVEKLQLAG